MTEEIKPPGRLYKYRSMKPDARVYTESIFRKNQVWYARASTFNDPFDCDHFIDIDRDSQEWREIMERFERKFSRVVLTVPGLLIQGIWNLLAKEFNDKVGKTSGRKLPELTRDKLLEFTDRISERSELTFGGRAPVDLVTDEDVGVARLNQLLERYFDESRRVVDQRFGVFSLAECPDNILMWSHYADEHAGICIEFDTESQPEAFPNANAVQYKRECPVIEKRFANVLMHLSDEKPSMDQAFLERIAKKDLEAEWTDREIRSWFLTKSTLWAYEKEWRSIVPGPGVKRIPAAAISGVVIGCKASPETEETVRAWVSRRRRKIAISRAFKKKGVFALDILPADVPTCRDASK